MYKSNIVENSFNIDDLFSFGRLGYRPHSSVVQCNNCGFIYSNPVLREEFLNKLYTKSTTEYSQVDFAQIEKTMSGYFKTFEPFLNGRDAALDIGSHAGILLKVLKDHGFKSLFGLEPSVEDTALVSPELDNVTIINDIYTKGQFEKKTFDLITAIHILDHLIEPNSFLETVALHLKDSGIFCCVTHNINSLLARMLKVNFQPIEIKHITFFTEKSLNEIIEKNGFEVIKTVRTYNNYTLERYIERSPFKKKKFISRLLQMCSLDKISLKLPLGNIAVICRPA